MMFWYGPGMDMWGYVVMTASVVMFWGLVILAVVAAARQMTRSAPPGGDTGAAPPTAEQVLADRFARGDIDEPEYSSRLATLRDRTQSMSGS
jgi:putative membrane protein